MKYIFVAGAPGSKWSSVVKNIYFSPSIDHSDYHENRTYYHDASGTYDLMHLGAYWDPGMEFGKFFNKLNNYSKEECEKEFDRPFNGTGVRIIKSHVFANHVEYIRQQWPDCPIVLVHRSSDSCLGWWVKCGQFDITYPDYAEYYQNLHRMGKIINEQNRGIEDAIMKFSGTTVVDNQHLAQMLDIVAPPLEYMQNYKQSDIKVTVI